MKFHEELSGETFFYKRKIIFLYLMAFLAHGRTLPVTQLMEDRPPSAPLCRPGSTSDGTLVQCTALYL